MIKELETEIFSDEKHCWIYHEEKGEMYGESAQIKLNKNELKSFIVTLIKNWKKMK